MSLTYPGFLVAVDKKRERVFVLAKPNIIAVKIAGKWNYGQQITDEEIEKYYELVTDLKSAMDYINEAKSSLRLP